MNKGLIKHFVSLPDPRVDRTKRYPLNEIILLVVAGTLSGCDGWKSIKDFGDAKLAWLQKFLPYSEGIPVDDTLARVMRKLDTKAFKQCFIETSQSNDIRKVTHDFYEEYDAGHGRVEHR